MRPRFEGLWRHPDFVRLWGGQTVSMVGSAVTSLALPTVAILALKATALQVGILGTLHLLAFPVLGLVAGVWVDRLRRRPVMITCDVVRAVALSIIPLTFALHALTMEVLYAVALITGICRVFFDVAYQSYLPSLIERKDLVEGNTKLEISSSSAQIAGPSLAGFLIQIFQPAWAIVVDAVSFIASALSIAAIRKPEPRPQPATLSGRRGFWVELGEGVAVVLGSRVIRLIAGCTATSNLGNSVAGTVALIFIYRQLHLTPAFVGTVFGLGSVGALVGALVARRAARWLGLGRVLIAANTTGALAGFLLPLAALGFAPLLLVLSTFLFSAILPIYNINQVSLRQAITPDRVQGRMNATIRTFVWGTLPIGSLIGGFLGDAIGLLGTLLVAGSIRLLAAGWLLAAPVRTLREQPAAYAEEAARA